MLEIYEGVMVSLVMKRTNTFLSYQLADAVFFMDIRFYGLGHLLLSVTWTPSVQST